MWQIARALAEYRHERFTAARDWAARVTAIDRGSPLEKAAAYCAQAMASARLRREQDARPALDMGQQLDNLPSGCFVHSGNAFWRDWAAAEIVRREAAELMLAGD